MKKLALSLSGLFLLAACATGPAGSPSIDLPDNGGAAQAVLCNEGENTSLNALATELETLDPNTTDMTALQGMVAVVGGQIAGLHVQGVAPETHTAATNALNELTESMNDPNAVGQAATNAASALRDLEEELCV